MVNELGNYVEMIKDVDFDCKNCYFIRCNDTAYICYD